jgi:hypothetical protein
LILYSSFFVSKIPVEFYKVLESELFRFLVLVTIVFTNKQENTTDSWVCCIPILLTFAYIYSVICMKKSKIEMYSSLLPRDIDTDIHGSKERAASISEQDQRDNAGIPKGLSPVSTVMY